MVLRTAVSGLKAQYEIEGHQLKEAINSIFEKKPRLRKKYQQPDPSSDRLYQSGITHPSNDERTCLAVCGNNPSNLISRPERTKEEDNPAIHYGLIASANQLMKDALVRDKLAAEKDVLCFEMEAAGLLNHFPCVVIRGICDYSDSHKNKDWQGYAAMAAAAYAKDLLYRIPPNRVEAEKRISAMISSVSESQSRIEANISVTLNGNKKSEILSWLSPSDYISQQRDIKSKTAQDTGKWLLESKSLEHGSVAQRRPFFALGSPEREQKTADLLASVLKQLVQQHSSVPESVKTLYESHSKDKPTSTSFEEISDALGSVIANYSRTFILIDALDECYVSDGGRRRFLSKIFNFQERTGASLFATSRFNEEIREQFEGALSLEIRAKDEDVQRYLSGIMSQLPSCVSKSPGLQEKIKTGIIRAVDGMFLLARLNLDSLMDKTTPNMITDTLETLPKGPDALEHAYEKAIERIRSQRLGFQAEDRYYGQTPLSWAAENGHEAVAKLLLQKGAQIETKDKCYGRTPLMLAAQRGHKAVVKLLLEKGAQL